MKRVLIFLIIVIFFMMPSSAFAQKDNTMQQIEKYVEESLERYKIPGASLAILENEDTVHLQQWGMMSDDSVVKEDTPFLIGSLSKPFTALAIMILVEDGEINLHDPIDRYIPSFIYQTNSSQEITVLNLLEQTSGISQFEGLKVTDNQTTDEKAITEAVKQLSGVKLSNAPGEVYEYNSANYLLLGAVIEKVTNQSFSEFLHTEIFAPLGMHHTAADYETASEKGYVPGFESWFGNPVVSDGLYDSGGAPYGYIVSTANDLMKFLKFMLYGGDLLSNQYLEWLKTPPEETGKYGLGWHFSKTEHFPFHGGATPDFRSEMFFIQEENTAAVLLTNKYHTTEDQQISYIMEGIRAIIHGDNPDELPAHNNSIQWILLGITLLLAILAGIHLVKWKRKLIRHKIFYSSVGVLSLLLAIGLIPIFVFSLNTPWKSISLFAPDITFIIYSLILIFLINGIITLYIIFLNNKGGNIN
ncbi:serine hydrolase domain-containing protein [Gracilibacillus alcaliphilus]|uniref:serine hydrolase domain-containing protein n=1 Tax=Gracilibacillus alcaliphilus TaxID=1401441 RepID=UPI001957B68A|nr:serine hydrolase domain-containing protein [Gracilibacillus alcaliphilus]MBM7675787.1 CubicO group peptidase (beta-lactamase class C family) [Gracilibacillus alcaliphilus]